MEKHLYLSKHVFYCLTDNHCVFLDLRADQYLCLGRAQTNAIRALLNGGHAASVEAGDPRQQDTHDSDHRVTVESLLQRGLLVQESARGKLPAPPSIEAPAACLKDNLDESRPQIRLTHIWHFLAAAITASMNLRWQSIESVVRMVGTRKSPHDTVVDVDEVAELFKIFRVLRPYYPRSYLCLFDSLALLHFLARYGSFPQWVYGVKLLPFAAHCWVQVGDRVVNDIIDNVRDYTPIMSV